LAFRWALASRERSRASRIRRRTTRTSDASRHAAARWARSKGRIFGSYTLNLVSIGDVFDFYTIDDINFSVMTQTGPLAMTGSGVYQQSTIIGQQYMRLEVVLGDAIGPITLESDFVPLEVRPPRDQDRDQRVRHRLHRLHHAVRRWSRRRVRPSTSTRATGLGIPDSAVDVSDLLYFLAKYRRGQRRGRPRGRAVRLPGLLLPGRRGGRAGPLVLPQALRARVLNRTFAGRRSGPGINPGMPLFFALWVVCLG
jgi:hypothetical protein